jgi:hypothetical protein
MKLQQLPMGARFEYQGAVYVKTGPMMAAAETGEQKLIPRYAVLKPLDPMPPAADPKHARQLAEPAVLAAFDKFFVTCSRLVDESGRFELARARQDFLNTLKAKQP